MVTELKTEVEGTKPASKPDWKSKLGDYAYQLSILKVVTYVGQANVVVDANGKVTKVEVNASAKPIVTICDLVGGDITNVIPDELKADEAIRNFHSSQVEKAAAVLPNNLKALAEVIDKIF